MLERLRIHDLGVISGADLEFSPGLSVLTGETGAGKTMVLTSLRLLMGDKADVAMIRHGGTRIEVDGVFSHVPTQIREEVFAEEDEVIVSRTVPKQGRSRAAVNGRPLPLARAGEITRSLVTIHGQSDQWLMRSESAQRLIVDEFSDSAQLLAEYRTAWDDAVAARKRRDEVFESFDRIQAELAYLEEIAAAIDDLELTGEEDQSLAQDIDRLSNAGQLSSEIAQVTSQLGTEGGAGELLGEALRLLHKAEQLDSSLADFTARVRSIDADVSELVRDLSAYREIIREDPAELESLLARRAAIEDLMRGRGQTVAELLEWRERAGERISELRDGGSDPDVAEARLNEAQAAVLAKGRQLTSIRQRGASKLAQAVNQELSGLAMADAEFRISLTAVKPTSNGCDQIAMEMRPHPSAPWSALAQGASGGELSRLMLAVEVALGQNSATGTYVFDEVDSGVGGRTAIEVGRRLKRLAQYHQVIVVTHLPQIAALASRHFVVAKIGGAAQVREVTDDERIDELVRMMGGDPASSAARRHALELMDN